MELETYSVPSLQQSFDTLMKIQDTPGENRDLRLIDAFFAKVRWEKALKDVSMKQLAKLGTTPTINDSLHKIIQLGRQYIRRVCEELGNGNTIVRRQIMDTWY